MEWRKRAILWPWADRGLILLSLIIVVVRLYGQPPDIFIIGLAFPLFLLILVFRSPPGDACARRGKCGS
jgi:hypothetical protein